MNETKPLNSEISSNPLILSLIFSGILMSMAGVLWRTKTGSSENPDSKSGYQSIQNYSKLIHEIRDIQVSHQALIKATDSADKRIFPIGAYTVLMSAEQAKDYRILRDRLLDLFVQISSQVMDTPSLDPSVQKDPHFADALDVILHSTKSITEATTFDEVSTSLAHGFKATSEFFSSQVQG